MRSKKNPLHALFGLMVSPVGLSACSSADLVGVTEDFSVIRTAHIYAPDTITMDVGQEILDLGGNAIDATVAMSIASSITQPKRASLLAGGLCIGFDGETKTPFELDYSSDLYSGYTGLAALHAKLGRLPWRALVAPAHRLALDTEGAESLQNSLLVWMSHPYDFAERDPFAEHPLDYRWEIKPTFSQPIGMIFNQNVITTSDIFGQRELVTGEESKDVQVNPSLLVGSLDRGGFGVLCAQSLDDAPLPVDRDLMMTIPEEDYNHFPQLVMAYGEGNSLVRWLAAFSRDVPAAEIKQAYAQLLKDNVHALGAQQGYIMSYCPLGLPIDNPQNPVRCAAFNGENRALGWVTRN